MTTMTRQTFQPRAADDRLTAKQAASALGFHVKYFYRLIRRPDCPIDFDQTLPRGELTFSRHQIRTLYPHRYREDR